MSSASAIRPVSWALEPRDHWRTTPSNALFNVPSVRSGYRPARRTDPVALIASVAMVASAVWGIAAVHAPTRSKRADPLKVFSVNLMPPPPPSPATSPSPAKVVPVETPAAPSPAVVPLVRTPVQTALSTPAPVTIVAASAPSAAVAAVSPPAPPAAAPPAPAASGPIDGADLSVRMITATPPSYPQESRRRREQGVVKLLVLVGLDGRVSEVSVAGSSGFDRLDRAAQGAVKRWRWSPLLRGGVPVMVRGIVTIPFVLHT